ncbi:hypothetical protein B0H17DRAFT_1139255 [Mycena rosella]|uniref:Uncharacterized protein n=1 Tax=Mycena rosella TaxID=1033263 RepID=A0AAD7G8S8_MYCRO|nr:hypothetical protein B0H17DRAFT_1139255 [Mycena rosella]
MRKISDLGDPEKYTKETPRQEKPPAPIPSLQAIQPVTPKYHLQRHTSCRKKYKSKHLPVFSLGKRPRRKQSHHENLHPRRQGLGGWWFMEGKEDAKSKHDRGVEIGREKADGQGFNRWCCKHQHSNNAIHMADVAATGWSTLEVQYQLVDSFISSDIDGLIEESGGYSVESLRDGAQHKGGAPQFGAAEIGNV